MSGSNQGWRLCAIRIFFEPRDVWIGVYWKLEWPMEDRLDLYICLLPMLPINLMLLRRGLRRQWEAQRERE